jgi:hypothetical protein
MNESTIQEHIRAACNTGGTRAFRNNIAKLNVKGRWIDYGIPGKGGSDLIGWHSVTVTPDMVGRKLAIFLAIECKTAKGYLKPEQKFFIDAVTNAGGLAGVARSVDDAKTILNSLPC